MANQTMRYETILVFNCALGEEAVSALVEKFKNLIADNSTIEKIEDWGKRRLAYPIEDETEGYYMLFHYESKPDFPTELNRVLEITEGVLRSLVVRNQAEFKPEPAQEEPAPQPEEAPVSEEAAPAAEEPAADVVDAPVEEAAEQEPASTEADSPEQD